VTHKKIPNISGSIRLGREKVAKIKTHWT